MTISKSIHVSANGTILFLFYGLLSIFKCRDWWHFTFSCHHPPPELVKLKLYAHLTGTPHFPLPSAQEGVTVKQGWEGRLSEVVTFGKQPELDLQMEEAGEGCSK